MLSKYSGDVVAAKMATPSGSRLPVFFSSGLRNPCVRWCAYLMPSSRQPSTSTYNNTGVTIYIVLYNQLFMYTCNLYICKVQYLLEFHLCKQYNQGSLIPHHSLCWAVQLRIHYPSGIIKTRNRTRTIFKSIRYKHQTTEQNAKTITSRQPRTTYSSPVAS